MRKSVCLYREVNSKSWPGRDGRGREEERAGRGNERKRKGQPPYLQKKLVRIITLLDTVVIDQFLVDTFIITFCP